MLTAAENERVTRVGAGTPMGELLRRFWLPVLLSAELPDADGPPKKIVVMGEDALTYLNELEFPLAHPLEQGDAELFFKQLDLPADGALGEIEFFGRAGDAAQARDG